MRIDLNSKHQMATITNYDNSKFPRFEEWQFLRGCKKLIFSNIIPLTLPDQLLLFFDDDNMPKIIFENCEIVVPINASKFRIVLDAMHEHASTWFDLDLA
jgi:hypothetical protein